MVLIKGHGAPFKFTYLPKISDNINRVKTWFVAAIKEHNYAGIRIVSEEEPKFEFYTSRLGMQGGTELKTYDTDCGKIGILICYDSEFPELSRLLANEGMETLCSLSYRHTKWILKSAPLFTS